MTGVTVTAAPHTHGSAGSGGSGSGSPFWLIEQRYYMPVFTLFMLFRESASPRVERVLLATSVVIALYLFAGVVGGQSFL